MNNDQAIKILLQLKALKENDGMTLKGYKTVTYKTGYQVATEGVECNTIREALHSIITYNGNCGVWYSQGIYYIDKSKRIATKREAIAVGRACQQQSVLKWTDKSLIWLV